MAHSPIFFRQKQQQEVSQSSFFQATFHLSLLGPSAGTSLSWNTSPRSGMVSFHACIVAEGSPTNVAANADCAATASIAAHLRKKVYSAERLKAGVTVSAFACASSLRKVHDSSDHLPPTFMAVTIKRHRRFWRNSEYLAFLRVLAASSRTPSSPAACG